MELVLSDKSYKIEYMNLLNECENDIRMVGFTFCIPVSTEMSFESDIQRLIDYHNRKNLPEGWVSASTYWLLNESRDKIIGVIAIRHELSEFLRFRGGHIAYYVCPSERNKGYATKILSLALEKCRDMKIQKVLITCAKNNIGSMKTILNNGGVFHSEDIDHGEVFYRYWIDLENK